MLPDKILHVTSEDEIAIEISGSLIFSKIPFRCTNLIIRSETRALKCILKMQMRNQIVCVCVLRAKLDDDDETNRIMC